MNDACESRIEALSAALDADRNDRAAAHELGFLLDQFVPNSVHDRPREYTPDAYELHVNGRRTFRG